MSTLLHTLGLRALPPTSPQPPVYAASALITNFILAYAVFSTRFIKRNFKFDHNVNPRQDVALYGEQMVEDGKIKREDLDMVKRWESLYANAVENYPLFVGGVLFALHAGVPNATINGLCASYTIARILYGVASIKIATENGSWLRTICWWTGNISMLTLIGKAGNRLN